MDNISLTFLLVGVAVLLPWLVSLGGNNGVWKFLSFLFSVAALILIFPLFPVAITSWVVAWIFAGVALASKRKYKTVCPHCREPINPRATTCPSCRSTVEPRAGESFREAWNRGRFSADWAQPAKKLDAEQERVNAWVSADAERNMFRH